MPGKAVSGLMSRRVLIGAGLIGVTAAVVGWRMLTSPAFAGGNLTVQEAHEAAAAGRIVLIDIRRPDEWERTGIAEGAYPIDMRRQDFIAALDQVAENHRDAPIALICARGVRSAWLASQLSEAGYSNVITVPEGLMGSRAGPGWLKSNLPVRAHDG